MTRLIDVVLSGIGLLLTAPLVAIGALGIKLSSPGAFVFRAERAGVGGRPFTMYKLRTMHLDAGGGGRITSGADPRVFAWGRALRKLKVDELPQLANVLRGEMSLVGPRPEDVGIVRDHYTCLMWETLEVRPGVTGPGSLDYFAAEGALPVEPREAEAVYVHDRLPRKIALDLVYVRHQTVPYYLELLLRTALSVLGIRKPFQARGVWENDVAGEYLAGEEAPR